MKLQDLSIVLEPYLLFYFFLHITYLLKKTHGRRTSILSLLKGENSLMFNKKDITELIQTFKWFIGKGPRPQYGRWTYWEKFDYWAVFWGVSMIGGSGLILWFPEFFTSLRFTRFCYKRCYNYS